MQELCHHFLLAQIEAIFGIYISSFTTLLTLLLPHTDIIGL